MSRCWLDAGSLPSVRGLSLMHTASSRAVQGRMPEALKAQASTNHRIIPGWRNESTEFIAP
eukprot:1384164-Amphidinium_carterae.1